MRAYVLTLFAVFVIVLGVAGTINGVIDHWGVFSTTGEAGQEIIRRYVEKLRASERGLELIYQDRQTKAELGRQSDTDCYILGSSQTFFMDAQTAPNIFKGCRGVTNLGVSIAGFEDIVALSGILAENHHNSHVFIAVTAWMLRANPDLSWTDYEDAYLRGARLFDLPQTAGQLRHISNDWKMLLSVDYLLTNLRAEMAHRQRGVTSESTAPLAGIDASVAEEEDEPILLPNGRIVYPPVTAPDPTSVGDGSFNLASPEIDSEIAKEFEAVVQNLETRGLEVTLLLTPYHPEVMNCRNPRVCKTLKRVEAQVREIALRLKVKLIGSFDPRPFGLSWQDFIDDIHPGLSGVTKLKAIDVNPRSVAGLGKS
jgi:hypothetical protein